MQLIRDFCPKLVWVFLSFLIEAFIFRQALNVSLGSKFIRWFKNTLFFQGAIDIRVR